MLREIETGREKAGSVSVIDGGDTEGLCLLLIKVQSDLKRGTSTLTAGVTSAGNGRNMNNSAGKQLKVKCPCVPPYCSCFLWGLWEHNHALQELSGWARLSIHSKGCQLPPCQPAYNRPAAVSQTYRSSVWAAHFLTLLRLGWLILPTGWVALVPDYHLHAKCVFIHSLVLVL